MIFFLVPGAQMHTIGPFLYRTGSEVRDRVKIITLEWAVQQESLPIGTYVFSGLCVASDAARTIACELSRQLRRGASWIRILNDPERVLWRYDLLQRLHERGINRFRAYRQSEFHYQMPRFPVFLRSEKMHTGNLTPILRNDEELRKALARLKRQGLRMEDILAVEYVHAPGPDALFRKYTAVRVGDALIPRYLTWSPNWLVKRHPKDMSPDDPAVPGLVEEEFDYARSNPWHDLIWRVFEMANIEYGRVDYTVTNGVPQIWEINTAPFLDPKDLLRPQEVWLNRLREPTKDLFYERFFPALLCLDAQHREGIIEISFDSDLIKTVVRQEVGTRRLLSVLQPAIRFGRQWPRKMPFQAVRIVVGPIVRWVVRRYERKLQG